MRRIFNRTLPLNGQCKRQRGGSLVLLLFFWLVTCPVFGQGNPKRAATVADYHLWGNMYFEKISDYGNWIAYRMQYDEHPDTLIVQNTNSRIKYRFADGDGKFHGEKWFTAKHGETLDLLDLSTAKRKQLTGVKSYALSSDNQTLVTIEKTDNGTVLCLSKPSGGLVEKTLGVTAFSMSPTGDAIAYQSGSKVIWLPLNPALSPWQIGAGSGECHFAWQENGKSFAFISKGQDADRVFHAVPKERKYTVFNPLATPGFPSGKQIASGSGSQLAVSPDGQRVFFGLLDPAEFSRYDGKEIKVWNGSDKFFYPQKSKYNNLAAWPKVAAWFPYGNRFLPLAGTERPCIFFNATQQYAITYGIYEIGPQYKEVPNVNYYLTDLATGKTSLWLENQSNVRYELSVSPGGKYAAYLKGGNWWVYDFRTGKHHNVSNGKISGIVETNGYERYAFGVAGWGPGDGSLLVYDAADIWEIDLGNFSRARLTAGKEQGAVYRIAFTVGELNGRRNFDWHTDYMLDTKKGILLKAVTDTTQAYYLRDRKGTLKVLDSGAYGLNGLTKASKVPTYVWQSETFNSPVEFRVKNTGDKRYRVIQKSNSHHGDFLWKEPEIVKYKDSLGNSLKGILYYPADHDARKKYPMVVHIYQQQFYRLYKYGIPSQNDESGYNVQHLTAQGYFVFEPDIISNHNEPGVAAVDCVESGVKAVLGKGLVDAGRIALMGHSFGGYETNFIITKSDFFACAIASAGISDLQSFYLGISPSLGRPEIWRMESQQWDMAESLFGDRKRYERNSPMTYVADIGTPLFHWTGEADNNVNPSQTYSFYVALRRLDKKQVLVTYPNEKHGLVDPKNQKDLFRKVDDWLAYYLKKEPPAQWIADGIK